MVSYRQAAILMGVCLSLTACATGPATETTAPAGPSVASDDPAARIGALSPRVLPAGECGLFLWARTTERPLVLFSTGAADGTRMMVDGAEVTPDRTAAEGEPVFGQYPRQTFAVSDLEISLNVKPERRTGLVGGAVIRQGFLRLETDEGWGYVMPVAGLIACQDE